MDVPEAVHNEKANPVPLKPMANAVWTTATYVHHLKKTLALINNDPYS